MQHKPAKKCQESIGKHGDLFIPAIVRPQKAGFLNTAPHDDKLQVLHHLNNSRFHINYNFGIQHKTQKTKQNGPQPMAKLIQVA